jgi:rhodanese-related sulfurtransferase
MNSVTLEELRVLMASVPPLRLIEVLPLKYFQEGHLPSAVHLPEAEVGLRAAELLPDMGQAIVVYCASATCQNSHRAAAELSRLGYSKVSVFTGGKAEWVLAGLPLEAPTSDEA